MLRVVGAGLVLLAVGGVAARSEAHFVVLLPSADVVESQQSRDLELQLLFTHPMQQGPSDGSAHRTTTAIC